MAKLIIIWYDNFGKNQTLLHRNGIPKIKVPQKMPNMYIKRRNLFHFSEIFLSAFFAQNNKHKIKSGNFEKKSRQRCFEKPIIETNCHIWSHSWGSPLIGERTPDRKSTARPPLKPARKLNRQIHRHFTNLPLSLKKLDGVVFGPFIPDRAREIEAAYLLRTE